MLALMAKQSRADYFREYRATKAQMKDTKEMDLTRRGIGRAVEYLRQQIGQKAVTGHQAATLIERAMLEQELQEVTMRNQWIEALR